MNWWAPAGGALYGVACWSASTLGGTAAGVAMLAGLFIGSVWALLVMVKS